MSQTTVNLKPAYPVTLRHIVVLPLSWILGLLSLGFFGLVFPENFAFVASVCGVLLAITVLYLFYLRPLDRTLSLRVILLLLFLKTFYIYSLWTTYVYRPAGGGEIGLQSYQFVYGDSFSIWTYMTNLGDWWRLNGPCLLSPREIEAINNPQAALFSSLPFIYLPLFSEILIPWNVFYMTVLACAVYGIGRVEGFKLSACRAAFYLILIQPWGWDVMFLYKDVQCQMFFGLFILAVLLFRKKIVPLIITTVLGAWVLHQYRVIYDLILIAVAVYAYIRGDGKIGSGILLKILMVLMITILAVLIFPATFKNIINHIQSLLNYYSIGQTVKDNPWLWHVDQIKHSVWIFSIPDRLIIALMAPFPWTEVLKSKTLWEFAAQYVWCLQTALMLVCFGSMALCSFQDLKNRKFLSVPVVFALIVAASGAVNFSIHSGYVQMGVPLTFPYVLHHLGKKRMLDYFFMSVLFFMVASLFWNIVR